MPDYNQVGGRPVFDVPLSNIANAASADIPAGSGVLVDPANNNAVIQPTAAGGVTGTCGIAVDTLKFGGTPGRVRMLGTAPMIAHGSISPGQVQISDTAGHLGQVKTKGANVAAIGFVLTSAADGDPIEVFLAISLNA